MDDFDTKTIIQKMREVLQEMPIVGRHSQDIIDADYLEFLADKLGKSMRHDAGTGLHKRWNKKEAK